IDEVGGIVRLGGVHGRHAAIGLGEGFNELLVLGVVEVGGVGGAGNHAHRQRFEGRQGGAVDGGGREQRNLPEQARLAVLLDEVAAHAAGVEHIVGIGVGGLQLGDFGR